ncbi:MAG: hypothetical protein V7L05_01020 [Nostoc sp.]
MGKKLPMPYALCPKRRGGASLALPLNFDFCFNPKLTIPRRLVYKR